MTFKDIFGPITLALVTALIVVTVTGFVVVPADAILPVHWGPSGEPDGFMGRTGALLMPLGVAAGMLLLFAAVVRFSAPERLAPGRHLMRAIVPALVGLFLVIETGTVLIGAGVEVQMVRLIVLAFGLVLVVMGNMLPKTQPNARAGIRLPWTLSDPAIWQAAHRVSGTTSLVAGLALIGLALVTGNAPVLFAGVLVATLLPLVVGVVVSWRLTRRA